MLETGIVKPDLAAGALPIPGLSSMNMSSRPVRGRSSAVQLVRISPSYFLSMLIFTTPSPFFSATPVIRPIWTPEIRTLCP